MLEAYLLGLIPEQEQTVIADLIASDAELTAYVHDLDTDLASHFLLHSVPPPPAIRGVIELKEAEQSLQKRNRRAGYNTGQETDSQDTKAKPNYIDVEVDNTHIRVHKNWRPAFVAIFILSKIFLVASVYYYFKADSQTQEINRLKAEIHQATRK